MKSLHYIKSGWGFDVGQNFARAAHDMPIELAPKEFAKPGHVIGYIEANPSSSLGFLKYGHDGKVRVHVTKSALGEEQPAERVCGECRPAGA